MIVYNPNDPELRADPYPTYRRLLDDVPLYHHEAPPRYWALSRHADVASAWRNFELYSSDHGVVIEQWGSDAHRTMSFLAMDPPGHTRIRALISRGFTPARVDRLRPRIAELSRDYLEPVLDKGTFDFVTDFAAMIPVDVISELIGVPVSDRPMLRRLSEAIMEREDVDGNLTGKVRDSVTGLAAYYTELVAERRRHPREDLASALLAARIDGDRLAEGDVVSTLMLLGTAGNETTLKLLATAWRLAWQHPGQRERAFADVDAWVEESLRFEGPSQYTARRLTREVKLHGRTMPADSMVLLLMGAANRDPRVFPDPDRYLIGRDTSATLAFGVGRHFCFGAALARLEARVVLREVAAAVSPDYEVHLEHAEWALSSSVRGHSRLPTTVTRRA
ncbi:cytochrome P450 [Nonomuraea sp. NPDC050643]|uniref:cytochrome P450 n=1 Tax=Nonomuraea sp. NPDC050643 TaxID=3155660 RepID=UPI0034106347